MIYYAGHGVQVARENYLLPADAQLERERDLVYEALSLDLFLGEISQARKLGMILLDACRNNPFVDRLSRSMTSPAVARPPRAWRASTTCRATRWWRWRPRRTRPPRTAAAVTVPFAEALLEESADAGAGAQPVLPQRARQRAAGDEQHAGAVHLQFARRGPVLLQSAPAESAAADRRHPAAGGARQRGADACCRSRSRPIRTRIRSPCASPDCRAPAKFGSRASW